MKLFAVFHIQNDFLKFLLHFVWIAIIFYTIVILRQAKADGYIMGLNTPPLPPPRNIITCLHVYFNKRNVFQKFRRILLFRIFVCFILSNLKKIHESTIRDVCKIS